MEITSVSFFGCSCGKDGDPHYDAAFAAAEVVARSGRRVVNGGGPGIMLAALGAYEALLKKNRHDHKGCTNPECSLLL